MLKANLSLLSKSVHGETWDFKIVNDLLAAEIVACDAALHTVPTVIAYTVGACILNTCYNNPPSCAVG